MSCLFLQFQTFNEDCHAKHSAALAIATTALVWNCVSFSVLQPDVVLFGDGKRQILMSQPQGHVLIFFVLSIIFFLVEELRFSRLRFCGLYMYVCVWQIILPGLFMLAISICRFAFSSFLCLAVCYFGTFVS